MRSRTAMMTIVGLVLMLGLAGCGGGDEGVAATTAAPTTSTTPPPPTEVTLPSGAVVRHPSAWTSYGIGFAGSLELNIPGVANVSVRDAAASEYLYGPLLLEEESLDGAFSMFAFFMGGAEIGEPTLVDVDGHEMLTATVTNGGNAGVMAIMRSGAAYASVYAEAPTDTLPSDAVAAILQVLASITP